MWLKNEQQGDVENVASDGVASCLGADARLPIFRTGGLFFFSIYFYFGVSACMYVYVMLGFFLGENLYVW